MPLITRAYRKRTLKAGTIEFGGGTIDCVVRNLSESGAALRVENLIGLPEKFSLIIHSEIFCRSCRVIWRQEKQIGVRFDV